MSSIMVVEDEGLIALEIQESLENHGFDVPFVVGSGEEAVQKAITHPPDLILMDIHLNGEIDGIEATKRIKDSRDIPVIYLTAYSEKHTVDRAKFTEPYGYILKPVEEKSLQIAVEMALHNYRSGATLKKTKDWLQNVLKSLKTAVIICDLDGSIQFLNTVASSILHYDYEDVRGKPLFDVIRLKRKDNTFLSQDYLDSVMAKNKAEEFDLCTLLTNDEPGSPVSLSLHPIGGTPNRPQGVACIIQEKRSQSAVRKRNGGPSFLRAAEEYLEEKPVLDEKSDLASFLEVEIAALSLKIYDDKEASSSPASGQLEAYKNILRFYFGEDALIELEKKLSRD